MVPTAAELLAGPATPDTLESLGLHLRPHPAELLDYAGLAYEFEVEEPRPTGPVPKAVRRNVYLVVREAVHNAIKYINCQCVTLRICFPSHAFLVD